jgi:alkanesulfonate monooxygenase SsuD/methylene tetrahydromethanopterin reductase-like flavin-dependent oxidoreductase (luciferase family)
MELGIYTFGDITPDPNTGRAISTKQRYAEILAAAKLADETGLHVFGVGEHHRLDLPISSPAVVMAAIAGGTKRIRLSSAVTILSTLDPVRVFQDFATVDLLSGGRAELIAGRGAYIESFSLFGDDFANYDALFAEKLDLLLKLSDSERVTWNGRFRPVAEQLSNFTAASEQTANLAWRWWQSRKRAAGGRTRLAGHPCEHLPAARQLRQPNRRLSATSRRTRTRRKHAEGRYSDACPCGERLADCP